MKKIINGKKYNTETGKLKRLIARLEKLNPDELVVDWEGEE